MMNPTLAFLSVTNNKLTFAELLAYLRRQLRLQPLAMEALIEKVLVTGARETDLTIPEDELQKAANRWRRARGLDGAQQTQDALAANGLTPLDLQAMVESDLLISRFKQQLASTGLEQRFEEQKSRFARAQLTRLVSADEALARELLTQVHEGGDLLELAGRHELTVQGPALAYRFHLPAEQAEQIFGAEAGAVAGPFPGSGFSLVRIDEVLPAELDAVAAEVLGREAVDAWLAERLANLRIDWGSGE